MLDFEGPEDRKRGWLVNLFHSNKRLHDNSEARVLALMKHWSRKCAKGWSTNYVVWRRGILPGGGKC